MSLTAGDKLGPYEILAPIGKGGMGEVFRAHDPRTRRDVAIKVSSERFSERFDREVRAVAALNHPNICTLYDVGPNYLVMEFIAGESPQGPLPLDEALRIARQIGAALEAAHEKNITHRDLKPGNIKIKPDGTVKVLDFGLAKVTAPAGAPGEDSPTLSMAATQAGMILGTAGYMSPEQARGKPVDQRADIWAFGVVLYELLVGQRLFKGDDVSETLASVIKEEPKWDRVPTQVRRLLQSCLEKDPKKRLSDISGAWRLLDQEAQPARLGFFEGKAGWIAAGVFFLAAIAAVWAPWRTAPSAPSPMRFQIPAPEKSVFGSTVGSNSTSAYPIVSPDGHRLTFLASAADGTTSRLWVRDLDSLEARQLPGTEGAVGAIWSPDSRLIAFVAAGKLKTIDASGGSPQSLCDRPGNSALTGAWNRDGTILFSTGSSGLQRVSATGGVPSEVTALDSKRGETLHLRPSFLPDGRHFVYFRAAGANSETSGVYVGSLDSKPADQSLQRMLATNIAADLVVSPDAVQARLLFVRNGALMAQPFDTSKRQLTGEPVQVAEAVGNSSNSNGYFSSSANGVLAYRTGSANLTLTWFNRQGQPLGTVGQPGDYNTVGLSPDGAQLAFQRAENQNDDLWLIEFARNSTKRFTFGFVNNVGPVWSPDGTTITFGSTRDGVSGLYRKPAGGVGNEELLVKNDDAKYADDWSRDGRVLIYSDQSPNTKRDLWILTAEGDRKPSVFLQTEFNESEAKFSPDGHWVAYQSDASGKFEVYVRPFPATNSGSEVLISNGGGSQPRWRRDGKELFYFSSGGKLMAVDVATSPAFKAGVPHLLFEAPIYGGGISNEIFRWDMTGDAQRFLINTVPEEKASSPITVVLNWPAALKK